MLTLHGIQMQDVWPPVARLEIKPRVTHNDETPMQGIMDGNQKEVLAEDIYVLHTSVKSKHVMIMTLGLLVHCLSSSISTTVPVQNGMVFDIQKQKGRKRLTLVQDLTRKWFLSAAVRVLIASLSGVPSRPAHTRHQRAGLASHHLLSRRFIICCGRLPPSSMSVNLVISKVSVREESLDSPAVPERFFLTVDFSVSFLKKKVLKKWYLS